MPLRLTEKDCQWSQDSDNVFIQLPLKGANRKRLDVYVNDVYLKVNYPPYLFEMDLWETIDQADSATTIQDGYINIQLRKSVSGQQWPSLKCELGSVDEVLQRRQLAVERQQNQFSAARQQQEKAKFQQEQEMVQKLIEAERNERARIAQLKMDERRMAEGELNEWIIESADAANRAQSVDEERTSQTTNERKPSIMSTSSLLTAKLSPPPRRYGIIKVQFTNNTVNDHPARDKSEPLPEEALAAAATGAASH